MMFRKNNTEREEQNEYPNDWLFRRNCLRPRGRRSGAVRVTPGRCVRIVEVPKQTRGADIERLDLVYQVCTGETVILGLPQNAGHLLARRLNYFFPTAP